MDDLRGFPIAIFLETPYMESCWKDYRFYYRSSGTSLWCQELDSLPDASWGSLRWRSWCDGLMFYTPGSTNSSRFSGKWGPRIESMYFLLKMGDVIPACYFSLPEGTSFCWWKKRKCFFLRESSTDFESVFFFGWKIACVLFYFVMALFFWINTFRGSCLSLKQNSCDSCFKFNIFSFIRHINLSISTFTCIYYIRDSWVFSLFFKLS